MKRSITRERARSIPPASLSYSYEDATCLVTISQGKFFSLGLDLDVLISASAGETMQFMVDLQRLYCRLLTLPLVTVAAANGIDMRQCSCTV